MQEINKPTILHLTSLDSGGAGKYTMDFHRSVLACGYESYVAIRGMEVVYPDGSRHEIKPTKSFWWNKLRRWIFRQVMKRSKIDNAYSMYNLCERFTCHSAADTLDAMPVKPDLVCVHWVSDYANAEFLAEMKQLTRAEIVFIIVDHAIYSGGCHYQIECQGYKDGCHNCPATSSYIVKRAIEKNYAFKKKYLPKGTILINGEEDRTRLCQSSIYRDFRFERIVTIIDAEKYKPSEKKVVLRAQWHIPHDKKMVLFGATSLDERRKGMKELIEALPMVQAKDAVFVAAGNIKNMTFPENMIAMGYLNEEQLIQMYQMADVFVCPSLADAGPMMVNQSLMCGTPVVAFPVGVSADLIKTGVTGYLAKSGDSKDLAKGIDFVLQLTPSKWQQVSNNCRQLAIKSYVSPMNKKPLETMLLGII